MRLPRTLARTLAAALALALVHSALAPEALAALPVVRFKARPLAGPAARAMAAPALTASALSRAAAPRALALPPSFISAGGLPGRVPARAAARAQAPALSGPAAGTGRGAAAGTAPGGASALAREQDAVAAQAAELGALGRVVTRTVASWGSRGRPGGDAPAQAAASRDEAAGRPAAALSRAGGPAAQASGPALLAAAPGRGSSPRAAARPARAPVKFGWRAVGLAVLFTPFLKTALVAGAWTALAWAGLAPPLDTAAIASHLAAWGALSVAGVPVWAAATALGAAVLAWPLVSRALAARREAKAAAVPNEVSPAKHESLARPARVMLKVALAAGLFALLMAAAPSLGLAAPIASAFEGMNAAAASMGLPGWLLTYLQHSVLSMPILGPDAGLKFMTTFVLELSLSLDNLFVFMMLFKQMGFDAKKPGLALKVGLGMMVGTRLLFVGAGTTVAALLHLAMIPAGLWLLYKGVEGLLKKEGDDEAQAQRRRVTAKMIIIASVLMLGWDLLFAVDSLFAGLGVEPNFWVIFPANAFAIMGMGSLYKLLQWVRERFPYTDKGVAVILALIGLKLLLPFAAMIPLVGPLLAPAIAVAEMPWVSLALVLGTLAVTSFVLPAFAGKTGGRAS